jgi:hypothetical protein
MVISGIYLAIVGLMLTFATETMFITSFETFTAKGWSDLLADYPKAGELFLMGERFFGVTLVALALMLIFVSWKSYSKAQKWSWYALLITNVLGWGGSLAYDTAVGYVPAIISSTVVIVIVVIALVLPAKAILGGKSSKR